MLINSTKGAAYPIEGIALFLSPSKVTTKKESLESPCTSRSCLDCISEYTNLTLFHAVSEKLYQRSFISIRKPEKDNN